MHFQAGEDLRALLDHHGITQGQVWQNVFSPNELNLFREIDHHRKLPEEVAFFRARSLIHFIFMKCLKQQHADSKKASKAANIDSVVQYVRAHPEIPHRLENLAKLAYLSKSGLSHAFQKAMGESVGNFVLNTRMSHAAYLLTQSDKKIDAVAAELGYSSIKSFYYAFKRVHGITRQPTGHDKIVNASPLL